MTLINYQKRSVRDSITIIKTLGARIFHYHNHNRNNNISIVWIHYKLITKNMFNLDVFDVLLFPTNII